MATNYYVKNAGNDANTGLSDAQAWQTIAKLNATAFSAGDAILLNKGDTWRDELSVPSDGSIGSPIVFGAYGTGVNPIISGSNILTDWTSEVVEVTPAVDEVLGNLATETFDAAGYDLGAAWTETVGAGSTVDEDNTDIADPDGGATQILKVQKVSANFNANSRWRSGSAPAISYSQVYVKVTAEGLSDGDVVNLLRIADASFNQVYAVRVLKTGTTLNLSFRYYDNGADVYDKQVAVFSLNQWYKIEVKWDLTNSLWEWRINGVSEGSGALSGSLYGNPRDFQLGDVLYSKTMTAYFDNFKLSSSGYPAPAAAAVNITTYKKLTDVKPNIVYQSDTRLVENVTSKASLIVGQFWWDAVNTLVYVRTTGDDNVSGYTMEVGYRVRVVQTNYHPYLTFDGLTIRDANDVSNTAFRVGLYGDDTGITIGTIIKNCIIERSAKHGIEIKGHIGTADLIIEDCIFRGNGGHAIKTTYDPGATLDPDFGYNNNLTIIRNNTVHDNGWRSVLNAAEESAISICGNVDIYGNNIYNNSPSPSFDAASSHGIYNIYSMGSTTKIHDNIIHDHECGYGIKSQSNSKIYKNKIYSNHVGGIQLGTDKANDALFELWDNIIYDNYVSGLVPGISCFWRGAGTQSIIAYNNTLYKNAYTASGEFTITVDLTSLIIKNNIFFVGGTRRNLNVAAQTGTVVIDYNIYWRDDGNCANYYGTPEAAKTWGEWQALGFDVHGLNVDPLFVSSTDFHLQVGSPAIDAGTDVSATTGGLDFNGASLYGSAYDIGAFEWGVGRILMIGTTIVIINNKIVLIDH